MARSRTNLPIEAPFYHGHFVFMLDEQFAQIAKLDAFEDSAVYGWGHGGPCYYGGRAVIRESTLGL